MQFVFAAVAALVSFLPAQNPFASRVVSYDDKGGAGGGIFDPRNALGPPGGTFDVHSLGIGGQITLGFDVVIVDGPGADFLVAENAFLTGTLGESFAEMMFVEVSSNGVDFARVPNGYYGPQMSPGPFAGVQIAWYSGLAGAVPVDPGARDAQDVVTAGGDAIDLADLHSHPMVQSGRVDLHAITQVRLIDVVDGVDRDSRGRTIHDPGAGSADVDAVTVIHHAGNVAPGGPRVEVQVPSHGNYTVTLSDPDGLGDLDVASWKWSLYGIPLSPVILLQLSSVVSSTQNSLTLRLGFPLPPGFPWVMACSIKDRAGNRSGARRARALN